ncbi:MAG: hypothetical protein LBC85_07765 [Fibromonadaceae bacterium]|jgi:hypothetical protein|nr:hypothetical protein [Fibromonadaceae bacterium]
MKILIKIFTCIAITAIVLLACNDVSTNNAEQVSSNEMPIMDSKVISYKRTWHGHEYRSSLGNESGFTTDKDILALWFPHIFNEEQTVSECNYFALYFTIPSNSYYYLILSQDMIFNSIFCNSGGKELYWSEDFIYEIMLICDDKKGKLKESIDLNSTRIIHTVPDWDCESGIGGPNWEKVFF